MLVAHSTSAPIPSTQDTPLPVRSLSAATRIYLALALLFSPLAHAATCNVIAAHTPTEAETAFLHSDYDHAAALYQAQLQKKTNDPALTAALALVYLRQQKITEANDLVQKALTQTPDSAILLTSLGEIQYREGKPWLAATTAASAGKIDLCYAQLHLLNTRIYSLNSMYASAAHELSLAHQLDPHDPQIRRLWMNTLPTAQRIAELESYLNTGGGDDDETTRSLHLYLDHLKQLLDQPHKACHLVSGTDKATVDFVPIMRDATHTAAFGLDVKFNEHNARLQIDTGASGLVISRSVANRAGLKEFSETEVGGIGSEGRKSGYIAYADDIKIGSLEFRDCQVRVIDQRSVVDRDGLIGMDVFSRFLTTLDYPTRKLILGPLPPRPDEAAAPAKPDLQTASSGSEADDNASANSSNPATANPQAASSAPAPPKPAHHGPYNRYIAPEMKDWTPIYRIGHQLLLPALLNTATEPKLFIMDTGAFTTSVTPEVGREVSKIHEDDHMHVHGISGKVDEVYRTDSITFHFANIQQKVEDVYTFASPSINRNLGMEISGFIGYTALGQLTISIDYRDGLVKFTYDSKRGYGLTH
jgi:tetratricopeptide (TPR) repeat protein